MSSQIISIQRRKRKDTQKTALIRSKDYQQEMDDDLVSSFDRASEPPLFVDENDGSIRSLSTKSTHDSFYQLSLNTIERLSACDREHGSTTKRTASSEIKAPMKSIGLSHHDPPKKLQVVKIISSGDEGSAKLARVPQSVVQMDDAIESGGIASRTNSSEFHQVYSTDKPHNFSIQESPVKKVENTLNSLDCSFDVNLKSIDADKSATQESVTELKWITFGEPFKQRDGSGSLEVSFSMHVREDNTGAFASSAFVGLDKNDTAKTPGDANVASSDLVRQLEERLTSLERIVHSMEKNTNTMRVSDSMHSDQSLDAQTQDMAFIIEGTEILQTPLANEEITCTDWSGSSKKKSKGSRFSVKRIFRSRFFGKIGGMKSSLAEM